MQAPLRQASTQHGCPHAPLSSAGILSPADLQDLESFLKPDYNPDQDFLPPGLAPSLSGRQGE